MYLIHEALSWLNYADEVEVAQASNYYCLLF